MGVPNTEAQRVGGGVLGRGRALTLGLPPQDKSTPLHRAAYQGHEAAARLLLEARADTNAKANVSGGGGVGLSWALEQRADIGCFNVL